MSQPTAATGLFRTTLPGRTGRDSSISFSFDGRSLQGYGGETVAATLLAHGIHLVGRSFKYHRPRGILAAGIEEPNALLTVGRGAEKYRGTMGMFSKWMYCQISSSVQFEMGNTRMLSPLALRAL